jgi:hypothetical protein
MADLHFSRNTKVYLEQGNTIWEIPVLDGFSFSQATNATEITLNEMAASDGTSRRSRQMFTDSYAPAEWSFASYVRPNADGAVEEALWANFVAANTYDPATHTVNDWAVGVTKDSVAKTTEFDFDDSNKTTLGTFNLYFVMGACGVDGASYDSGNVAQNVTIYKITDCVANSASIDFDIDGIATINWSGFGQIISEPATFNASTAITTGVSSTANYIRNRLTSLSATSDVSGSSVTYSLVLTGGNITFENNITYLTPETLCEVNTPLGHVTGTRSISGNFTCYLNGAATASADLFEDIISATTVVTNSFDLTFSIGGSSAPSMSVAMPQCHLEVPTHSIEDVVSLDTTFHALPSTTGGTDEAVITYTGS